MDFCGFSERIIPAEGFSSRPRDTAKRYGERMEEFALGMVTGVVVGAAVGMVMAPSQRQMKRAANKAAKKVGEAVGMLTEAMDL